MTLSHCIVHSSSHGVHFFAVGICCSWMSVKQTVRIHTCKLTPVLQGSDSQSSSAQCFFILLASQLHSSDILGINRPDYMAKMKTNRVGKSWGLGFCSQTKLSSSAELRSETIHSFLNLKSEWKKPPLDRPPATVWLFVSLFSYWYLYKMFNITAKKHKCTLTSCEEQAPCCRKACPVWAVYSLLLPYDHLRAQQQSV